MKSRICFTQLVEDGRDRTKKKKKRSHPSFVRQLRNNKTHIYKKNGKLKEGLTIPADQIVHPPRVRIGMGNTLKTHKIKVDKRDFDRFSILFLYLILYSLVFHTLLRNWKMLLALFRRFWISAPPVIVTTLLNMKIHQISDIVFRE